MAFDFDREWPFFPDDEKLRVLEPRANVAVLIGHSAVEVEGTRKSDPPLAVLLQQLPQSIAPRTLAAIGTIATLRDGVERVVQNLLTNPHVTVLFLCGEDSPVFYPLEGLACLHRYGVDEGRHVIAGDDDRRAAKIFARDALATLSHEDIACFRARPLEIVDCRGTVDPARFFAEVAARLPGYVRRVERPSWAYLDAIDVYRWRPRVLQVPTGELKREPGLQVGWSGSTLVVEPLGDRAQGVVADGKPDGRAQRALHTTLRKGLTAMAPGWESRLAWLALLSERAVLRSEFGADAVRAGIDVPELAPEPGLELARPSPLELDAKGFFKIRALYEQGILAADYHDASGRHVETLHAKRGEDLLVAIIAGDYLGELPARAQHLVYLGVQIGRADFALRTGLLFEEGQPLSTAARKNVEHHLSVGAVIVGRSLEETWVHGLTNLREQGLLTTTQKGRVAEGWCTFFLVPAMDAVAIPRAYPASEEHIAHYAAELLTAAPEVRACGDYTYGDRTCHYFFNQIAETGRRLAIHPAAVCINQRWVPEVDLPATAHHRPCLVFDLWFSHEKRLHTLQIARSHDVYGGLPQNALGVARGWGPPLAAASGLPLGDVCFLSISNNYRVGDDAENVRRAIQGGVGAAVRAPTLPSPTVSESEEHEACQRLAAATGPIAAVWVPRLRPSPTLTPERVLAAEPVLASRLLRYKDTLDQVQTLTDRLRAERSRDGQERSNSLLLSPRDPVADRADEATPLVCMQLRRQLGRLHAAAVVVGERGVRLTPLLLELQRAIATRADVELGGAMIVRIDTRA